VDAMETETRINITIPFKTIWLESVLTNIKNLEDVPSQFLTDSFIDSVYDHPSCDRMKIAPKFWTKHICWNAIESNPYLLAKIPKRRRSKRMEVYCVKKNGLTLGCIPSEDRTHKLCKRAIANNTYAWMYVPTHLRTPSFYVWVTRHDGLILRDIPKNVVTKQMCMNAVKTNFFALKLVPDRFFTRSMCMYALDNHKHRPEKEEGVV
jgi:hypothetical protein